MKEYTTHIVRMGVVVTVRVAVRVGMFVRVNLTV